MTNEAEFSVGLLCEGRIMMEQPPLGLARKRTPESSMLRGLARDALVERNNCEGRGQGRVKQGEAGVQ